MKRNSHWIVAVSILILSACESGDGVLPLPTDTPIPTPTGDVLPVSTDTPIPTPTGDVLPEENNGGVSWLNTWESSNWNEFSWE